MKYPGVAAAVVICKDERVLLGKRHDGTGWGFPGGKVELYEKVPCAAARELEEESGIEINEGNLEFLCVVDCMGSPRPDLHYVTAVFLYRADGRPINPRVTFEMTDWLWVDYKVKTPPVKLTVPAEKIIACMRSESPCAF